MTSPIERWDSVEGLFEMLTRDGLIGFAVASTPALDELFTFCLAEAQLRQQAEQRQVVGMITWGMPCGQYQAHTVLLPVRRASHIVTGTIAAPWWVAPFQALERLARQCAGQFGPTPALRVYEGDAGCGGR